MSLSKTDRLELGHLLDIAKRQGFDPIGLIFYDPKTKLLGLAPLDRVPEAFVEQIGRRLGDLPDKPWIPLVGKT